VEVIMWNRFMSSPYAHFVTAMALTLGLVVGLLVEHPGKSGVVKVDASAQNAPSEAARPELASSENSQADRPAALDFDTAQFPGQPNRR
jgi:hypothetical protein